MQLHEDLPNIHTSSKPTLVGLPLAAFTIDLENVNSAPSVAKFLHNFSHGFCRRLHSQEEVVIVNEKHNTKKQHKNTIQKHNVERELNTTRTHNQHTTPTH